jgi:ABC-2 type transport system permease protein
MSTGTRHVRLVARREWSQRVHTLAFRISTLISILIVVALIVVPEMYGGGVKPARTVGVVGQSSSQLPALLRAAGDQLDVSVQTRAFADEAAGQAALRAGDVSVLLVGQRRLV